MKKPTIKTLKDFFGAVHKSDFSNLARFRDSAIAGWLGFITLCLAITWLTSFSVSNFPEKIEVGQVLNRDIRADRLFSIVNEEETKKGREKSAQNVLPVYDYDEIVSVQIPTKARAVLSKPIVIEKESLLPYRDIGIVLQRTHPGRGEEGELVIRDLSKILTVDQLKSALPPAMHKWIVPNTTFNLQETESRKEAALRSVKEKTITYQPGDYIMRAGTKLEPSDVDLLERIKRARGLENIPVRFMGTFLFVALAIGATFYFSEAFVKRFLPERKDYLLMGLVIVIVLLILRISLLVSGVIHEAFFYNLPRSALYYAIPVAGGVMLVRMVLTAEISLVLAVILSLLAGLTVGSGINYTTYCLISCIAAGSAIVKVDHRSAIIKAGVWTGFINAVTVLGILLIEMASSTESFQMKMLTAHLGFAFMGGILSSIFVLVMMPLIETLFDYTTDIKLLELANLSHPLLKELVVQAPGTYHHSHVVGLLAEAAAEAVGANSLLARVSAYYHDIGKMKKSEYFIENTGVEDNRHTTLSPHMSALIVASHVKEGVALAKAHKLPQRIIDMIPEHHGTKKIGFFYEKAKEQHDPETQEIKEEDFRYGGPKPQSREAGILMLADGVEATVRSLKEKTPARIQQTVEKIIDSSFVEAQLDECDLTLRDLHEIAKAFTRVLIGMYHQRIDYAANTPGQSSSPQKAIAEELAKTGEANVHRIKFPRG
ncbi:MAG: HDIG domain-containing protein [Deltaproteobacteria bacterium]|nr:HDIG domain-containing protein [Deltaproteobacteria bacterium]